MRSFFVKQERQNGLKKKRLQFLRILGQFGEILRVKNTQSVADATDITILDILIIFSSYDR